MLICKYRYLTFDENTANREEKNRLIVGLARVFQEDTGHSIGLLLGNNEFRNYTYQRVAKIDKENVAEITVKLIDYYWANLHGKLLNESFL
jgi:hypothetical protein